MNAAMIVCLASTLGQVTGSEKPSQPAKPAATGVPDASGFFRLGEYYEAQLNSYYYLVLGPKIGERYAAFESECRRLGAPPEVLEDLAALHKGRLAMPFLSKSWTEWTPEQSRRWADAPKNQESVWKTWLDQPDHQPRFFWHLGRTSLNLWFFVGGDVLDRGVDVKTYERSLRELTRVAYILSTDPGYAKARERLSPDAAAALKSLADLNGTLEDPFGEGVTVEQVKVADTAARKLRDLARSQGLTVATAPSASH